MRFLRLAKAGLVAVLVSAPPVAAQNLVRSDSASRGPVSAPVTVVLFCDFQCQHCASVRGVANSLAETYPNVHLDTTMALTQFTESLAPYPRELRPRMAALQDKVVLGSDFPNIPYEYAVQLEALERLDLGDDWLRAVCWENFVGRFADAV